MRNKIEEIAYPSSSPLASKISFKNHGHRHPTICRWDEYSPASKKRTVTFYAFYESLPPSPPFFRVVKRKGRSRLIRRRRGFAGTKFFPRGLRAGARSRRNMTVNFSRIHRAERMECPFIVSKRAASTAKTVDEDSVSKAQLLVSLHFWIPGARALAPLAGKRRAARPAACRIRASPFLFLFSSPFSLFLPPFLSSRLVSFLLSSFPPPFFFLRFKHVGALM